tara:strand:+ start:5469 stop:7073 length:1605 start_codon:yes stop_codon:yes gene_type:complete
MKLNLLDCTLRDGGYYNNWDFNYKLINDYLRSVYLSGIEYVEVGFRSFEQETYRGPCAYTKDSFLQTLKIPKKLKIGVMINASEIISHSKKNLNIKKLFPNKKDRINFVRIACHFHEVKKVINVSKFLKSRGYKVIFNLMQCADKSLNELYYVSNIISKYPVDVLYFADSMGSMTSEKTSFVINSLKKNWSGEIGIHTHDNMLRAFTNTDQAIRDGVNWIDGTVSGMGRGPGNIKTEYLLINYSQFLKKKVNLFPILNLIKTNFKKLQEFYNWGTNPFYFLAGKNGIHPTFIQDILKDDRYDISDKLLFIEHLKNIGGKKFSRDLLDTDKNLYLGKLNKSNIKKWNPASILKNKTVLIIGNSPQISEYTSAIEDFIRKNKPIVFGLNIQKSINEKLINYRVACNLFRLLTDKKKYKKFKNKFIIPFERQNNEIKKYFNKKKVLNFDLQIISNKFNFKSDKVIIPNSLVVSYALGIAASGKSKNIILAGFQGYNSEDPRQIQMDNTFNLFKSNSKILISSITPTKYKIKIDSLYV